MAEYLDFQSICGKVSFTQALDLLGIPYEITKTGVKGEGFIANKKDDKEYYFNPKDKTEKGGSVIQFVANKKGVDLRTAAKMLKDAFLDTGPKPEPKRNIPALELEYHEWLTDIAPVDLCKSLNVGFCKQKSIMSGRILQGRRTLHRVFTR